MTRAAGVRSRHPHLSLPPLRAPLTPGHGVRAATLGHPDLGYLASSACSLRHALAHESCPQHAAWRASARCVNTLDRTPQLAPLAGAHRPMCIRPLDSMWPPRATEGIEPSADQPGRPAARRDHASPLPEPLRRTLQPLACHAPAHVSRLVASTPFVTRDSSFLLPRTYSRASACPRRRSCTRRVLSRALYSTAPGPNPRRNHLRVPPKWWWGTHHLGGFPDIRHTCAPRGIEPLIHRQGGCAARPGICPTRHPLAPSLDGTCCLGAQLADICRLAPQPPLSRT